jgi:hypothetical protein
MDGPPATDAADLSRFSVPLQYDFSAMLNVVERAVPTTFGSIDSIRMIGTDTRRHYAFEAKRGKFAAFGRGGRVHLRATLAYRAQVFYKPPIAPTISAGCGGEDSADRPRIVVEVAAPLSLSPNWHLASHARIVRVEAASTAPRDRCDVSILNRDMTPRVVEAARAALAEHLPEIDRKVGEVDLTEQVTDWWGLLSKPIQLADGVWLLLGPQRLRMGAMSGHDRVLTVPVTLDARPRIVTTPSEPQVDTAPLPPLAPDAGPRGFSITMDGIVDYGSASRGLEAVLLGRHFRQAGHNLVVRHVAITPGTKGRLALAIGFTGDAHGTLRFIGTPKYDEKRGLLAVPDLDYDLEIDNHLINGVTWLRSDALRAQFREQARFPVSVALTRARALLLEGLNRKLGDAVTLSATVDSVGVKGLFVTRDGIMVRADATGHAAMAVKQH